MKGSSPARAKDLRKEHVSDEAADGEAWDEYVFDLTREERETVEHTVREALDALEDVRGWILRCHALIPEGPHLSVG